MEKKTWVMPELIVLVRSKPEEAVLTACKGGGTVAGPRGTWWLMCSWTGEDCSRCAEFTTS